MILDNITTDENLVSSDVHLSKSDEEQVRLELIDDEELLHELYEQWKALAATIGVPVYQTYEWLSLWWKHFGKHPKRELFIVALYNKSELLGLAPLFMGTSSIGPVTFQRRLHLMGSGVAHNELLGFTDNYGYSDFLDILAHPDYKNTVAEHVTDLLDTNPMDADVACFNHVSDESFVITEILPRLKSRGIYYGKEKTDECPYVSLPDSMDEYKDGDQHLGSSSRRRRFRKNINPVGDKYPVEQATSWEEVKEGLDNLYTLHQDRWNSLGYPGGFFDERHHNFLLDMSRAAFENGWLWLKLAQDNNGFGAVRLALKYQGRYYDWASGFDASSSISKHRPGLGLLSLMIKEGIEEGDSRIELLRGAERYKFDFTRKSRDNWRLTIPFYLQRKSSLRSFVNRLLNKLAKAYYRLKREWKLLKVQYREKGYLKMFYGYISFRTDKISEKLEKFNLLSGSDK